VVKAVEDSGSHKRKRRAIFKPEEDDKIIEGVRRFGTDFEQMRLWADFARSAGTLRNRYKRIAKLRGEQLESKDSDSDSEVCAGSLERERESSRAMAR